MINFFKKYFILIILVVLILILIILRIVFGQNKMSVNTNVDTSINKQFITPTIIKHEDDNPTEDEGETIALPYMGKKMEISGYSKPGVLEVLIEKEEDKMEAEIEVKAWLEKYPYFKGYAFEYTIHKLN